jgi:NAD(P)-dependent dehydrogenase (short-subunit alcohol dehydrogenase family)
MNEIVSSFRPDLFKGKHVLISGGTRGIGLAIARGFARLGASVRACGSTEAKIAAASADPANAGIVFARLDARDTVAVERFVGALPALDVLVNTAGIARPDAEWRMDAFLDVMDVNLNSAMRLAIAARPLLARSHGAIINTASMLSYIADATVPAYCASKTGILGLTRALAHEFGRDGIRVNAIAPGYHTTEMTRALWDNPESARRIAEHSALKRWGTPEDLVGAVLFLASPAASFITGVDLPVDGGYVVGNVAL